MKIKFWRSKMLKKKGFHVLFSPDKVEELEKVAESQGLSVASFIRMTILKELSKVD